ncbi:MAG: alpha/beta hydrolase, partial [Candidatus Marinimicrobia bacterium]|nr:alpha/beta hydrolase [Candidatus Neomarinimicrobiota bacterium]
EMREGRRLALYSFSSNSDIHLFFIHGAGGRADQWKNQIDHFKDEYRITTFDLLGHGRSPKPKEGYGFNALLADAAAVFERHKGRENIIIGHSYGVALALHMAALKPNDIQKLVLIGANIPRPASGTGIWKLPAFVLEWIRPIFSNGFVKGAFHSETSQEFIKKEQSISDKNPMFMMKRLINGMKEVPDLNLRSIDISTLVINGEADGLTPVSGAKELVALLPNAELIVVEKASHLVMMEQPEMVNEIIRNFITHK